jgi:hypothetical protein
MADSLTVGTRRDGTITLKDGAASSYVVSFEVGDFASAEQGADRVVIRDRGAIVGLRKGDDPVLNISFSVHMRSLTDTTADNIMDRIYNLQTVEFKFDTSAVGGKVYTATYSKVYLEVSNLSESADGNTIEVTGEVYGGVVYAQT